MQFIINSSVQSHLLKVFLIWVCMLNRRLEF
jgi:hypothetical protein